MKLLPKIIIVMLISAVSSTLVLETVVYFSTQSALERSTADQQVDLAKQTMDKVDRFLYEKTNNILLMAEDERVESYLSGKDRNNPQRVAEIDRKIGEISLYTGPWDTIDMVDLTGKIVLSTHKSHVGENIQTYHLKGEEFTNVLKQDVYYSDVFLDEESHKPIMIFAAPIRNEDDPKKAVVGMVVAHFSWQAALEILQAAHGKHIELFNNKGIEIGDSHPEHFDEIFTNNASNTESVQNALAGKSGSKVQADINGTEKFLVSYVPEKGFLNYKGNKWILLIETPVSEAFASARESVLNVSLLIVPIIIVIITFLLILFQRIAIAPIRELTSVAEEIAKGDLTKRVPLRSKDEIGQLATAFNNMANKLQEVYAELEKKIGEKTAELTQKVAETEKMNHFMLGRELKMIELKKEIEELKKQHPNSHLQPDTEKSEKT